MIKSELARGDRLSAKDYLISLFKDVEIKGGVSAQYIDFYGDPAVVGIAGLDFDSPFISVLLENEKLQEFWKDALSDYHVLITAYDGEIRVYTIENGVLEEKTGNDAEKQIIKAEIEAAKYWGGVLNEKGELIADPSSPAPGPHYYTNMLIGNRMGFVRPLQSTPKSAVNALGGGCFRAHADTQVLGTRWDYLPEENGFPANRQFYLTENGKQIFYSGSAKAEGLKKIQTIHSQNRTVIEYELEDGLKIRRTIFIVPQHEGLPLAMEAQKIDIINNGDKDRHLRIVYTGMFGIFEVHALREDVIFTTVIEQSEVFYDENDEIKAIGFNPNPKSSKSNIRYNVLLVHEDGKVMFPQEYCARYADLVGNGSLEKPEFVGHLANKPSRKGPGFFALATPFTVKAGGSVRADDLTCLTSDAVNEDFKVDITMREELAKVIERYSDTNAMEEDLQSVIDFAKNYSGYMQIEHDDKNFEAYVNNNLPFQVFYQTFVSRSLDWTQKGYREIGFREIQDIFASMYYMAGMDQTDFVKKLLREWSENVFEDGYANHNFYWTGKEPGWWSDDALWLLQALDRYVGLTGDYDFLNEQFKIAGTATIDPKLAGKGSSADDGSKTRTLLETIKAIITYSAKISVGKHGIPLIDRADWNDCLRVDPDCIGGAVKIEKYKEQLAASGKAFGEVPFESEYSESVMNGFLLKVAVDAAIGMFEHFGDTAYANELKELSAKLKEELNEYAWKNDFFARVLFNRKDKPELVYLGAAGDNLQVEDAPGSYFLNSFSWSLLADCASEAQITSMLDAMDNYLKSPYGFRLCSTVDYPKIAPKIDVALYYPGDRENGGVFKHANMMAAAAMLKAAKSVKDVALAKRLADTAYWIIDVILPFRTLKAPFTTCGNPRWCTQYNNSDSGENIGPTLSGTSTWLLLCLFSCFGIQPTADSLIVEPMLRENETHLKVRLQAVGCVYEIEISKPEGFKRTAEGVTVVCDGQTLADTKVPVFTDGQTHKVEVKF
ncbi:MAG: glycosyl transferase [Saccharofermentans sp.]|nr:glycosyl transferase [Saccharofermentans sp.]